MFWRGKINFWEAQLPPRLPRGYVPESGEFWPVRTFCGQRSPSGVDIQTFSDFPKIMVCPHGKGRRGGRQCEPFA